MGRWKKSGSGFEVEVVPVVGIIIGRDNHPKSGVQFQATSELTEEAPPFGDWLTDTRFEGIGAFAKTAP